jgi:hypothetical protein
MEDDHDGEDQLQLTDHDGDGEAKEESHPNERREPGFFL